MASSSPLQSSKDRSYATCDKLVVLSLAAEFGTENWARVAGLLKERSWALGQRPAALTAEECRRIYDAALHEFVSRAVPSQDSERLCETLRGLKRRRLAEIRDRLEGITRELEAPAPTPPSVADKAPASVADNKAPASVADNKAPASVPRAVDRVGLGPDARPATNKRPPGEEIPSRAPSFPAEQTTTNERVRDNQAPGRASPALPPANNQAPGRASPALLPAKAASAMAVSPAIRETKPALASTAAVIDGEPKVNAAKAATEVPTPSPSDSESAVSAPSPERKPKALGKEGQLQQKASKVSAKALGHGSSARAAVGAGDLDKPKPELGTGYQREDEEKGGVVGRAREASVDERSEAKAGSSRAMAGPAADEQQLRNWKKNIGMVWREISGHRLGGMFIGAIKSADAPHYYEVIRQPLDLKTIKNRIRDEEITTTVEFYRDIMHMLMNALMYNGEDTEVYQMTMEILPDAQACIEQLLQTEAAVSQPVDGAEPAAPTTLAAAAAAVDAAGAGDDDVRGDEHDGDDSDASVPAKRRRRVASERASKYLRE